MTRHTDEQCKEILSRNLRALLKEKKTTSIQVARAIGITPEALSLYLRKKRLPRVDIALLIADYFDVSIDYLVKE